MNLEHATLADFRLVPAPIDRFRRPPGQAVLGTPLRGSRSHAEKSPSSGGGVDDRSDPNMEMPLPFFWYSPPWHLAPIDRCRFIADLVGSHGITVSALQKDISEDDHGTDLGTWSRLAPHRCDRAGWSLKDCQTSSVIELRLGHDRDTQGHFRYSREQVDRWQLVTSGALSNLPLPVPLVFPPEWRDISQMGNKIAQLRCLGHAAIYISCDEMSVTEVLPVAVNAGADGVILRCADDPTAALWRCTAILRGLSAKRAPAIWITCGELSAEDCVKCFALGASAVAIDRMCNVWLLGEEAFELTAAQRAAMNLGVVVGQSPEDRLRVTVGEKIDQWCSHVAGILQSLFVTRVTELTIDHLVFGRSGLDATDLAGR